MVGHAVTSCGFLRIVEGVEGGAGPTPSKWCSWGRLHLRGSRPWTLFSSNGDGPAVMVLK